jgi:hypothetical protein
MKNFTKKHTRMTLVAVTTIISIFASLSIIYIAYHLMGVEIRRYELVIGITAPLLIASPITWYLYGLLKRLNALEEELRNSISKEKEAIYLASILGAQHVINNLLNQLKLVEMEINKQPNFDKEIAALFVDMLAEASGLMNKLSSVKEIEADAIKRSVDPGDY